MGLARVFHNVCYLSLSLLQPLAYLLVLYLILFALLGGVAFCARTIYAATHTAIEVELRRCCNLGVSDGVILLAAR